ncbi:Phosphoglucosamine mutase [Anaerohalosphaera lusitana]|uniref:Phosphoglucosamine mutase n=1 Tax=Anaerohalosphaera lusitana TaxID=1936003 RepID=A0A1U9NM18_9BACT|nr:phosphoglucosamine mutase [Anaerohalosphaera lusitana]AQT68536.1 Phosphoglucosamine mutase [Anaerohalosphaera lusitana]
MARELILGISGMRGIIGENLNANTAVDYGCAFGTFLQEKFDRDDMKVCIGRDSRVSGSMIFSAVASGLCSVGIDVIDLGIVTTPGVGLMVRHLECVGGVVITASHNPIEYNGIKLLTSEGVAPPKDMAESIIEVYKKQQFNLVDSIACGAVSRNVQTHDLHVGKVLDIVDTDAIATRNFKAVLDSVNGAGGTAGRMLLDKLGCEVTAINAEPTGIFAHTPEPTKENLVGLCDEITKAGADIGFAQDPDADRLAIVDENGVYIGEEYTLALCAKQVLGKMKGKTAANLSTSRMIDDVAGELGCEVIRTAVGEANVADAMIKNNCIIGGEGNGGIIDLRVGPIRDSLVGMALVLQLMADSGKTVSELVGEIGAYHVEKSKFEADKQQAAAIIEEAKKAFPDAEINTVDGCRFDFSDGWVHLRTSNTEPVMRLIVETETPEAAKRYVEKVDAIRDKIVG